MSYIHRFNVNHYSPSESLKNLFNDFGLQAFNSHQPTTAWVTEVKNKKELYHREKILRQGRTDFDEPYNGLSPKDKVLLYCYYYMPMHLYSSYHIFSKHLQAHLREKIVFIDVGCGPLTSGIAFWTTSSQMDITYIGIDRSHAMLNKAREINQYGSKEFSHKPFFEKVHFRTDFVQLPHLLDSVAMGNPNTALIVFNFCYILASHSFDDNESLDSFIGVINRVANEYEKHKICVIYQNPSPAQFQENWKYLKSGIASHSSKFNISGISEQETTKVEHLRYETILEAKPSLKVSYDSFDNFSYLRNQSG